MKALLIALSFSITGANALAKNSVQTVRVYKSERRMELVGKDNQVIKTYKVMLGQTPVGAKAQEGDNKTPEGVYDLDLKNDDSDYHKSIHISYPNFKDKVKARMRGVNPGGDIMLHGFPNEAKVIKEWLESMNLLELGEELIRASLPHYDWTNGCIAVSDAEIDEIYKMIDVPTKIIINP